MANTTNFGWETPDDTDLVKDGAAAMRTLGSAIDTSFVDLKGGTTGQNLRKATNTDLDFTWAGDATNTVIDAEGDLLVGDSADTLQRLAIGTTGQVLTVDTAVDGKVKWAAAAGGGKVLQVVQDSSTTQESTTSGTYVDTALSLTITPTSATSTILILVSINASAEASAADSGAIFRLVRGATQLAEFAVRHKDDNTSRAIVTTVGPTYYDSPATTSATTYKIQFAQYVSGSTAFCAYGGFYSSITALEIGA
jgi:hypothetical protein